MIGLKNAICATLIATSAMPAAAASIVNTGTQTGNASGGPTIATFQYLAGQFTLASATTLTDLQGYIASGVADTVRVSVRANNGTLPGASLFSATFTASANNNVGNWQGVSGQNWALAAGTYWISFESLTGSFTGWMPATAPNPLAAYAFSSNQGTSWAPLSQRPLGVRIDGFVGGAVPEPATWALMLVGFGLVGGAMRQRRAFSARHEMA